MAISALILATVDIEMQHARLRLQIDPQYDLAFRKGLNGRKESISGDVDLTFVLPFDPSMLS